MAYKLAVETKQIMRTFFLIIFGTLSLLSSAQIDIRKPKKLSAPPEKVSYKVQYIIGDNGDTIPTIILAQYSVIEQRVFSSKREERKWSRLKRDVAKVYPYSKLAGKRLMEYNEKMKGLNEKQQKRMLKQAEQDLKNEFEGDLRNMTLNQGRILIKLIDRETGNTSYGLVKDLRGSFQAFFWQSLAKIFSTNLKSAYNPYSNPEDRMIEDIILTIEDGTFLN